VFAHKLILPNKLDRLKWFVGRFFMTRAPIHEFIVAIFCGGHAHFVPMALRRILPALVKTRTSAPPAVADAAKQKEFA